MVQRVVIGFFLSEGKESRLENYCSSNGRYMQDFTREEAEAKKGKRVRARFNGALSEAGIKEGMEGKVSGAALSLYVREDSIDVWTVEVKFYDRWLTIPQIHKDQYEENLEEIP